MGQRADHLTVFASINDIKYMSHVTRKPAFCTCDNKGAADQRLCFRYIASYYFLNPKFPASNHLLGLHSLVCVGTVGPGRKPRRLVFNCRGSFQHHTGNFEKTAIENAFGKIMDQLGLDTAFPIANCSQ